MSDVVLRCPNCGTTQPAPGECDACHESDVRYYCTNHTPGRWLDGPACPACGAQFGVERSPRSTAPPTRPSTLPPAPTPARGTRRTREPARPRPTAPPRGPTYDEGGLPPVEIVRGPFGVPIRVRRPAAERAERAERVDRVDYEERPPTAPPDDFSGGRPPRREGLPVVGCLVRLVLVLVVLAVLAIGALFAVFGGGVQGWMVDVGQSTGVIEGLPEQTERGIAAYRAGQRDLAERELRESAQSYRRSAIALLYLARIRSDAGDYTRAEEYLRDAAAREPDNPIVRREVAEFHYVAAERLRAGGANAEAVQLELRTAADHYVAALRIDPSDRRALGYYSCTLAALGAPAEAEQLLARAGSGPWEGCGGAAGVAP